MSQSDSPSLSETAAIADLLRDLISAQDDVTSANERGLTGPMRRAQQQRDAIRDAILQRFHELSARSSPSLTEASDSGTTKSAPSASAQLQELLNEIGVEPRIDLSQMKRPPISSGDHPLSQETPNG